VSDLTLKLLPSSLFALGGTVFPNPSNLLSPPNLTHDGWYLSHFAPIAYSAASASAYVKFTE